MSRRGKAKATKGGIEQALGELRKQAHTVVQRLQRIGRKRIRAIERQIDKLNQQRQALLEELGTVVGGFGRSAAGRAKAAGARRRGGRRTRVDWNRVFSKLPKGSFKASDVRRIVPSVAPGTLSQRLTGWVKEKKLRRTGSRRGTRYTKAA
jgi:DNA-binding HxlR family transcriptional regulator